MPAMPDMRWNAPDGLRARVGGKGLRLIQMRSDGYPVPPFHVIEAGEGGVGAVTTEQVAAVLDRLRADARITMGVGTGSVSFAVRSSAPTSMPGMMDTVLCLGVTPADIPVLTERLGDVEKAWSVVMTGVRGLCRLVAGVPAPSVDEVSGSGSEPYATLVALYEQYRGRFPASAADQVSVAIAAVAESWNNVRAQHYRASRGISEDTEPAVVVQAMAYGTAVDASVSGVVFSHSPISGRRGLVGEYLPRSTGEGLVSGTTTPLAIELLRDFTDDAYLRLAGHCEDLFRSMSVMVEVEFVVERGRLWLVQARPATGDAQVHNRVAVDAWRAGVLSRSEALHRLDVEAFFEKEPARVEGSEANLVAKGIGASSGVATGRVVTTAEEALSASDEGAVLLRPTTEPEDFLGMAYAVAVVTLEGGSGSHAAVVARELGTPAVVGAKFIGGRLPTDLAGKLVTVCGTTGTVWSGIEQVVGGEEPEWPADLLSDCEVTFVASLAELSTHAPDALLVGQNGAGDGLVDRALNLGSRPVAFVCSPTCSESDWRVEVPRTRVDYVVAEPGRRRDYVRAVLATRDAATMGQTGRLT